MQYIINPICKKMIDEKYLIFLKKRTGKCLRYVEINETGNDILTMLENGIDLEAILPEMMQLYQIDDENMDSVKKDIDDFLSLLVGAGIAEIFDRPVVPSFSGIKQEVSFFGNMQNLYAEKLMPFKFFMELTYACNLRCRHCYKTDNVQMPISEQSFINKKLAFKVIDEIDKLGALEVYFTGGEMFLNPDAYEIIEYASKKNFLTILLTNGNCIFTQEAIQKIQNLDIYDIRISIYGDEEHHDAMTRRKGSFEKSLAALKNIRDCMGIGTAVCVLTNENFDCLDEMTAFFDKEDINYVLNSYLTPTDTGEKFPLNFRVDRKQFEYLYDNYDLSTNGSSCAAGLSRFRISPKGDVNPCELFRDVCFGNINDTSLSDIINGQERKEFIQWFRTLISNHPCNKCEIQDYCTFCPGAFYLENGDYYKPSEYVCDTTKIKKKHADKNEVQA